MDGDSIMNIIKLFKLLSTLNLWNKIRLVFHLSLTVFFKLTGKRLIRKTRINVLGIEYDVTVGHGELDIIYHTNVLKEYMQLEGFIPTPGAVCIDVGANIGSTALAWTKALKTGKIYAIEPHPETYLTLLRNIQLNGVTKTILPRQFAIASNDGEIVLFVSEQGSMAMKPGNHKWRGREILVGSITADSFIKEEGIESIDILKIDIEGFEVEALQGAKETLRKTKRVVLEYHSPELRSQCLQILTHNGFEIVERDSLIFCQRK